MSLILDALNKSDREHKDSDKVPDLNTQHHGFRRPRNKQHWLAIGLAAAALMLLAILLALWLRGQGSAGAQVAAPEQPQVGFTPPHDAANNATERKLAPRPEVEALYQAQQGEVKIIEPVVRAAPSVQEPQQAPQTTDVAPTQNTIDEGLARSLWEESRTQPLPDVANGQVIRPTPTPTEPKVEAESEAAADFDSSLAAYADVPFLHELAPNLQDQIPTLMYAQHSFDKGSVTFNQKRYQVGDAITAELLLEQILADGVLLSFAGEQFKLAALSSWVNQ